MTTRIPVRFRFDTAANWTSVNPILKSGEPGFESDTGKMKVGDGTSHWSALAYASGGGATLPIHESDVTGLVGDLGTLTSAISAEAVTRAAADALLAPLASPALTGNPTAPTQAPGDNSTKIATDAFVAAALAALVNSSPSTLDTLKELADALGDDPNFATTISALIGTKLAKASNLSDVASAVTALANLGGQPLAAALTAIAGYANRDASHYLRGDGYQPFSQVSTDLGIPASLNVLLGSIDVPRRSLDRVRGAPNGVDTQLNGAITSTATTITVANQNCTVVGENPLLQLESERVQVIRGQGTTSLVVRRGVDGTTAASHADKTFVVRDKVRSGVLIGDSTCQGVSNGTLGDMDYWSERMRRIFNERFGGSLGAGFYGLQRPEWSTSGTWFIAASATAAYFCGPWVNNFGSAITSIQIWTRPAKVRAGQIDVHYIVWSNTSGDTGTAWSYSLDGGVTWIDNPNANVDPFPTNTTTLASADNGRALSYWDGTKTMTLASTTGITNNAGFFFLDVGSGGSGFKCRAKFTYDGVSGSTLTNVKYAGPAQYAALTTSTGDTGQQRPELRKTSIAVNDPADFRVRCGTAAGTGKLCNFAGIDVWSSAPTFGVTRGTKLHNLGYSGNRIGDFVGARMVNDGGVANGQPTIDSKRAAWSASDVGSQVIAAGFPAGTIITGVSGTVATCNNNWTGSTVAAGSAPNPITVQGMRGTWDAIFNGSPASLIPAFLIECCWTNDMSAPVVNQGGDQTMTATFVNGSPNVVITAGNGIEACDVGALFMDSVNVPGTNTSSGTVIAGRTDSTHITISPNAVGSATVAVNVAAPSATVQQSIKDRLGILHSGGIAGDGVTAYADRLLVVPFEQGVTRLSGISSTAAYQADYRQAMHDWATANRVATLDIYKAWASEGNVGFAAASADLLMDSTDSSGFHEGPVGYRDMASRITRLLEFA